VRLIGQEDEVSWRGTPSAFLSPRVRLIRAADEGSPIRLFELQQSAPGLRPSKTSPITRRQRLGGRGTVEADVT
jgi:hypothetical protein